MAQEIELKLTLPEAAQRAFLRHPLIAGGQKQPMRRLVNVYYDTPNLDLQRHGVALRIRHQGRIRLQTVKCQGEAGGGLAVRPEWEQPYAGRFDFSGIDDAPLRNWLERQHRRAGLAPAFETVFCRRAWRMRPAQGTEVLLMLDRGWIAAEGRREAISEIELELERGETAVLFDLALALARDLPLVPGVLSKAERGYRLRAGRLPAPVRAAPSSLDDGQTPLQALRAIASACLLQLQLNALDATQDDPEFVHQMRVALRRLRSVLRCFRPVLPEGFEAALVPSLRALARQLGHARDWDVLAGEIVAPACRAFPEDARLAALAAAVERRRQEARGEVRHALAARSLSLTLLEIQARLQRAPEPPAARSLREFAAHRLGRLRRRALALAQAADDMEPTHLHALRIGVKRLRYALEFFAPLYPPRKARRAHDTLAALQDGLGALNDLSRAGPLLMQCIDADPALREAVALVGGWHGPRYAELRRLAFKGSAQLGKIERFWKR